MSRGKGKKADTDGKRRKRGGADAEQEPPAQMALNLPAAAVVKKVSLRLSELKSKSDDARMAYASAAQDAAETHGIDNPAMKFAEKLRKMDAAKRRSFVAHVNHYLKVAGVDVAVGGFEEDAPRPSVARGEAAGGQPAQFPADEHAGHAD
jgi:hypothetical protein